MPKCLLLHPKTAHFAVQNAVFYNNIHCISLHTKRQGQHKCLVHGRLQLRTHLCVIYRKRVARTEKREARAFEKYKKKAATTSCITICKTKPRTQHIPRIPCFNARSSDSYSILYYKPPRRMYRNKQQNALSAILPPPVTTSHTPPENIETGQET